MPKPLKRIPPRTLLPEVKALIALRKHKGWTVSDLRDLLRDGVMAADPPSVSCLRNWLLGMSDPRAHRMLQIETFVQTHSRSAKHRQRISRMGITPEDKSKPKR